MSTRKQVFSTCTLKELCPEDKQKVAQLVKQVVELGKENQQLKTATETAATAEDKLRQVQECNKQAIKENCSLKNKLGQAITVLRMYHHKVQGLDAALRALQHSAPAGIADANPQQQQHREAEEGHEPPLPLPPPSAGDLQRQQPAPADNADSSQQAGRSQVPPAQPGAPTEVAANSQQGPAVAGVPAAPASHQDSLVIGATGQLPAVCVQETATGTAADPTTKHCVQAASSSPNSIAGLKQPCACSSTDCVCVPSSAPQLLSAGRDVCLGLPVQQLQAWHLQDNSMFAGQQAPGPPALLQFDASIGSRGAFIIRELPWLQGPQLSTAAGGTTAATKPEGVLVASSANNPADLPAAAAAAAGATNEPRTSQRQLPPQQAMGRKGMLQQQELVLAGPGVTASASGAATAAAAAAASSALAAVKAAAAVCAATPWDQHSHGQTPQQRPHTGGPLDRPLPGRSQHLMAASTSVSRQAGSPAAASSCVMARRAHVPAALEEVPVVDMTAAPVHVLVQNEKSASSMHQAHAHVTFVGPDAPAAAVATAAAAAAEGAGGVQSTQAWLNSSSGSHPQMYVDPWQDDAGHASGAWQQQQQQQPASTAGPWSRGGRHLVQQPHPEEERDLQGDLHLHHQQPTQLVQPLGAQVSYSSSSTSPVSIQHQQKRQQIGAQGGQWMQQAVGDTYGVVGAAGSVKVGSHSLRPHAAAHQQQDHGPPQVQAPAEQPRQLVEPPARPVHSGKRQQQPQQQQQQWQLSQGRQYTQQLLQGPQYTQPPQGHSTSTCGLDCGTRELLQRFDESLVDILAEVERLEQQQQRAHQQLQAQAVQQHPRHVQSIADSAACSWQDQGLDSTSNPDTGAPDRQAYLDQRQARLQQRVLQLQQEDMQLLGDRSYPPPGKGYRHHMGSQLLGQVSEWGYSQSDSSLFDADDVSDILNHLD